ncbi:hypothetical protein OG784_31730 [Streptomyces sp. NBC_01617]|nr:hypothetical protein OG987_31880 [Streptomyces sp. NBC_01620]WTE63021.1 hypothetical protein OG784_31730 [Streptomyces sp. NBC_01617]
MEAQQSASGAWVMDGALLGVAVIRFVQHHGFFNRFLAWHL